MSKPAAFSAAYSDWRLIKTRGVIQIILEVPLHASDAAYQVLNGMPNPASEAWVNVSRLSDKEVMPDTEHNHNSTTDTAPVRVEAPARAHKPGPYNSALRHGMEAEPPKRKLEQPRTPCKFSDMALPAQAGMLSNDPVFRTFIHPNCENAEEAAAYIRGVCGVRSRAEIQPTNAAGAAWQELVQKFTTWKLAEKIGAA